MGNATETGDRPGVLSSLHPHLPKATFGLSTHPCRPHGPTVTVTCPYASARIISGARVSQKRPKGKRQGKWAQSFMLLFSEYSKTLL